MTAVIFSAIILVISIIASCYQILNPAQEPSDMLADMAWWMTLPM